MTSATVEDLHELHAGPIVSSQAVRQDVATDAGLVKAAEVGGSGNFEAVVAKGSLGQLFVDGDDVVEYAGIVYEVSQ